jgi:dihydroorotase
VLGARLGTLAASAGRLAEGGVADICVFDPDAWWTPERASLRSQGKHSPFVGQEMPAVVRATLVGGQLAFESDHPTRRAVAQVA